MLEWEKRFFSAKLLPMKDLFRLADLDKPHDFSSAFGNSNPIVLDIGAGRGEFAAAMAQANPLENYLCIEIRKHRVESILKKKRGLGLENILVVQARIEHLIPHCFFRASIHRIHLNFPDPWPKNHQKNRRAFKPSFLDDLQGILVREGELHFATDVKDYAKETHMILSEHPGFENILKGADWKIEIDPPVKTLFYRHAVRSGIAPVSLHFRKV